MVSRVERTDVIAVEHVLEFEGFLEPVDVGEVKTEKFLQVGAEGPVRVAEDPFCCSLWDRARDVVDSLGSWVEIET